MKEEAIGKWSFLLGIIIAVLVGLMDVPNTAIILMILGLVVGFLNIETKETTNYLLATVTLLVVGIGGIQALGALDVAVFDWIQSILSNFIAFVGASAIVVAIRTIVKLGQD